MNVSGVSFAAADESCLRSGETLRSEDDESEEDEEDMAAKPLASETELAATAKKNRKVLKKENPGNEWRQLGWTFCKEWRSLL